ncbi:M48 family metallopeptidase [Deinococcus koreensis]|uniref:M48 family peptidase n=1 Tax=Deinococcus koreensis TaxID=2054903 RepID=A0A2K3UZW7_9DEIO|nr:SprT family zinc-dependent metalloprotease [Deinococcus koreensis]PNY82077.1 M48 family peptidase [Deinococcus koreensis]
MTSPWAIEGVPVQLRRSAKRRTVALQVRPGEITLYAPARVPLASLRQIVDARQEWIAHHLAQYAARPTSELSFGHGSSLPFLGQGLRLDFTPGVRGVQRDGGTLRLAPGEREDVQQRIEAWTRRACLEPYRALVEDYAGRLDALVRLGQVRVSGAQYRWGSCTAKGDIRLHWKLSRAPLEVLHYVALHEVAHLHELNHSARYWSHVARIMPDYSQHRDWLREWGSTL